MDQKFGHCSVQVTFYASEEMGLVRVELNHSIDVSFLAIYMLFYLQSIVHNAGISERFAQLCGMLEVNVSISSPMRNQVRFSPK